MVKVNLNDFNKQMSKAKRALDDLPEFAEAAMKLKTPYDKGNARRNTTLQGNTVVANYPYAGRLEDNWSSQTRGEGIIAPTEKMIQDEVNRRLKGL